MAKKPTQTMKGRGVMSELATKLPLVAAMPPISLINMPLRKGRPLVKSRKGKRG
jgi:hypothetical protein